jgi:hypothetical protein
MNMQYFPARSLLHLTRLIFVVPALCLMGAAHPETRIAVTLPTGIDSTASGRLLVFAERVTAGNASASAVDIGNPQAKVAVAARDVSDFGPDRRATIDTNDVAFPTGFAALPPGNYHLQAVLDRNGDYNYAGRGEGDLVSKVVTMRLPFAALTEIALDRAIGPGPGQFDTTGYPPAAIVQIAASREHLHDERIASPALTRFRGTSQSTSAWVLTPPDYDPRGTQHLSRGLYRRGVRRDA